MRDRVRAHVFCSSSHQDFSCFIESKWGQPPFKENGDSHHLLRALGLDRAYISNVENGKQNLTISTMEKVAKALGVSVDQLLKK